MKWGLLRYVDGGYVTEEVTKRQVVDMIGKYMTTKMVAMAEEQWKGGYFSYTVKKLFVYLGEDAEIVLKHA